MTNALRLDHDMTNNHFGYLSIRLKVSLVLKIGEDRSKIGYGSLKNKVICILITLLLSFFSLIKFDRQSSSSRVIAILDLTSCSLTLFVKKCSECYTVMW